MNRSKIILYAAWALSLVSCYKDKGNYSYHVPPAPVITHFDTVYKATIGDSLTIIPSVVIDEAAPKLGFEWKIGVPEELRSLVFSGPALRTVFGLRPQRYFARLTIIDSTNGMKYFYDFAIDGRTVFATGTPVLSVEGGVTQLSFIKPDGTVQARIYGDINEGGTLPDGPMQIVPTINQYTTNVTVNSYWIFASGGSDPGVQIDANTLKKIKTLKENFFTAPAVVTPGGFACTPNGTLQGVVNGKLYVGTSQTYSGSAVYGMFGLPAVGDYQMFREGVYNSVMPYFLGYDVNRKQVLGFTNFGSAAYVGTGYQVTDATVFDPKNMGLDLLHFQQINNNNCFAFGKAANDSVYVEKFGAAFKGFIELSPLEKKPFPKQQLIVANTKWAGAPTEIFYFSSGSTLYRYNPLNDEVKPLTTDFGGKTISMVKLSDDGNMLTAGVEGSLYTLDVSTGRFGDIIKKIDGIPGTPVDAVTRTN